MLNEIQMAYGFLDEETKEWVENNLKYLTESEKANYLDALKKEYPDSGYSIYLSYQT